MARLQAKQASSTEAFADKLYQYYTKMGTDVGTMRLAFEDLGLAMMKLPPEQINPQKKQLKAILF